MCSQYLCEAAGWNPTEKDEGWWAFIQRYGVEYGDSKKREV